MKVTILGGVATIRNAFEAFGFAVERGDKDGARRIEDALIADLTEEWGRDFARALLGDNVKP